MRRPATIMFRTSEVLKKWIEQQAEKDNRTMSDWIFNTLESQRISITDDGRKALEEARHEQPTP